MYRKRLITEQQRRQLAGFSLLEMVVAAALVTGTLVPALAVIRDAMAQSRALHHRHLLANYAVRSLEDQASYIATNWTNGETIIAGSYAADGHANIRYSLTKSDDPSDGGVTNQLMNIEVTVYDDADGDLTMDADEMKETYRTKVASLNTYANEEQ